MALTKYGPGKYCLNVDAYVHSLDVDEEVGSVGEAGGWNGLVTGNLGDNITQEEIEQYDLSEEDVDFLKGHVGAILSESDQGFVAVEYYSDSDNLNGQWSAVQNEIEQFETRECDT